MMTFGSPRRLERNGTLSRFYYVRVREGKKRSWRTTKATTRKAALEVIRTWQMRAAKGERITGEHSFRDTVERWLSSKKGEVSPHCYATYASLTRFWSRYFGHRPLRSILPEDVLSYFEWRTKKRELSAKSKNHDRVALKQLFRFCVDNRWLHSSPVTLKRFRETKKAIRIPTERQEEKLLEECRRVGDETYGFVLCLLESGLRRGTVSRLAWDDVDFETGSWDVPGEKMKSGRAFVDRPVSPVLFEYLRQHRKPGGLVFGALDGDKFRRAAKAAGVAWMKPHDCRRAFVSRCRRRNVAMELAMHLSDHADVKVVVEIYRGIQPEEVAEAAQKLWGSGPAKLAKEA